MIDFTRATDTVLTRWESVTRPLDRLQTLVSELDVALGISHQTP